MKHCRFIGNVPESVRESLASAGVGDASSEGSSYDLLVLHVPRQCTAEQLADLKEELREARSQNRRVALTSDGMTSSVLELQVYGTGIVARSLLNDQTADVGRAVLHFVHQEETVAEDADLVRLGEGFEISASAEVYAAQQQLSYTPDPAMNRYISDLVTAAETMAQEPPVSIPWTPFGDLQDAKSLQSVFKHHAKQRRLLHPQGGDTWSSPHLMLLGESGTGKSLAARLVAGLIASTQHSAGPYEPAFVPINCPGLPRRHIDHMLFGCAAGQWSGITEPVVGELARAAYGVAFLDEFADMAEGVPQTLLTFLQDGLIRPTGIEPFPGFVRVIAATNRDLDRLIEDGEFRHDLMARFSITTTIPPLRDRSTAERARLVQYAAIDPSYNVDAETGSLRVSWIDRSALDELANRAYWNYNVRELTMTVRHAVNNALTRGSDRISESDLPPENRRIVFPDRDAKVVDTLSPPAADITDAATARDLHRAAAINNVEIWRTPDGTEYVRTSQGVLRYPPATAQAVSRDPITTALSRVGPEARTVVFDVWGRALRSGDAGFCYADPYENATTSRPIASSLDGALLVTTDAEGRLSTFPAIAGERGERLQLDPAAECLSILDDRTLVVRLRGRLHRYYYEGQRRTWSTTGSEWLGLDASKIAKVFPSPNAEDPDELIVLRTDGRLNDTARIALGWFDCPEVVGDLDVLRQGDDYWVALAIDNATDGRRAVRLGRWSSGEVLTFTHELLHRADRVTQISWARGTTGDPMIVVALERGVLLDRRIDSASGTWKDLS